MKKFPYLRWTTMLWLVVGYAFAHGLLVGWLFSNFESNQPGRLDERYSLNKKGELIKTVYHHTGARSDYYDMDGNPLTNMEDIRSPELRNVSDIVSYESDNKIELLSVNDGEIHPTFWYAVEPSPAEGMYFVGYTAESKQLVGYIGRHGFSAELPASEDRFRYEKGSQSSLVKQLRSTNSQITRMWDNSIIEPWGASQNYAESVRYGMSISFAEKSVVWHVDLLTRRAKEFYKNDDIIGAAAGLERQEGETDPDKLQLVTTVLTPKSIIILDNQGKEVHTYNLPKEAMSGGYHGFSAGKIKDNMHVLTAERYNPAVGNSFTEFWWLDEAGNITRHEGKTQGHGAIEENPWKTCLMIFLVVPMPLLWIIGMSLFPYLSYVYKDPSTAHLQLGEIYAKFWSPAWPYFVLVILFGILMAWIAARREKRYFGKICWPWVIAVGIFGWAGLLAYWFHCHWPHLTREGKQLSLPPAPAKLTGAEVFA